MPTIPEGGTVSLGLLGREHSAPMAVAMAVPVPVPVPVILAAAGSFAIVRGMATPQPPTVHKL